MPFGKHGPEAVIDSDARNTANKNIENLRGSKMKAKVRAVAVLKRQSTEDDIQDSLRFKVVIWSINEIDIQKATFAVKLRVTAFWVPEEDLTLTDELKRPWKVVNRYEAKSNDESVTEAIPQIALRNATTFKVEGKTQVSLFMPTGSLRPIMRWTSMYEAKFSAPLINESEGDVKSFPYDEHLLEIEIKLSNGFHRKQLGKALLEDNVKQDAQTAANPAGHLEDKKDVEYVIEDKLHFDVREVGKFQYLSVGIKIWRKHAYYDQNIFSLNTAMACLSLVAYVFELHQFYDRIALTCLSWVAMVGFRQIADPRLPMLEFNTLAQDQLNYSIYVVMSISFLSAFFFLVCKGMGYTDPENQNESWPEWYRWLRFLDVMSLLVIIAHGTHAARKVLKVRGEHIKNRPKESPTQRAKLGIDRRNSMVLAEGNAN